MSDQKRRLYRSRTSKVIGGVCGGLAEYLDIDPTIVRLVWIFLTILGGSGIVFYILAYLIMPVKPFEVDGQFQKSAPESTPARVFGILFIVIGIALLLHNLDILSFHRWWEISWDYSFPSVLILIGIFFLIRGKEPLIIDPANESPTGDESRSAEQSSDKTSETGTLTNYRVLRRSIRDKKFLGICGGLGEYFDIDPTIIRIGFVIFTLFSVGLGLLCYFLMFLIMPEEQPQFQK